MLKNVINKFGIYAMLSAFVFILISCDNSTSPIEENSALKKDIVGTWEIYRKCIEINKIDGQNYESSLYKVGGIDTLIWKFSGIYSQDNMIVLNNINSNSGLIYVWTGSAAVPESHWMFYYETSDPYSNKFVSIEIELTEINPLKGTLTKRMYDSTGTVLKILSKFELSGVKQ